MPIIQSAKKKLRQDKKRHLKNLVAKEAMKQAIRDARKQVTQKKVAQAYAAIDKAVKKNVIHDNKAARLKSQLAHLTQKKPKSTA